ncbi:unnamed protein product [Orchesella dallaii]|uniref:Nucleoporin SEH1 n=1 Tax=Orchesella dallaii TaxID=48710 RepID=A0ABP1S9A0_9HEXA
MFVARGVTSGHKDLIHDVAFDFYGTRMATCSSDQTVRIWELHGEASTTANWSCTASWKAHSGSVWKVTWSNPEFGQVIATCSFDRSAAVWQEVVGKANVGGGASTTHWVRRTTLVDSRASVTDIKFAPHHLGLVLATCSGDGFVRIYEAPDIMNLTQWSLQYEIKVKMPLSCISWNPTYPRQFAPMIAVASDDSTQDVPKVMIYEYDENLRRWVHSESLKNICDPVNDISFAANLGRSYHLLGVAGKDLKVVSLEPQSDEEEDQGQRAHGIKVKTIAECCDHNSTVWRVAWNVTGTILASSGDDGCVRLWKGNYMGNWRCVTVLRSDGTLATDKLASAAAVSESIPDGGFLDQQFMKLGAIAGLK